ncbi:sensor histidine kinase [Nonomuraea sp. B10E15]|uniref:sensor histidine kinase n=1 Tax=Nonomuraea sp. B10E15 TaxID=3153560 RepID=UPI00325C3711
MTRWTTDAAVAAAVAAGLVAGSLAVARTGEQRALDVLGCALLLAAALPLAWRRARPVTVAVASAAACVAYYALLYPGIFAAAPVLLAVYTVVALGRLPEGVVVAVAFDAALYLAVAVPHGAYAVFDGVWWTAGFLAAVVVIGQMVATHRAYLREVELRAAEAERTREEAALRRAGEERLWIAQELHDTLTHTISVINVQAGAAAHLLAQGDPAPAGDALAAIRASSQDAMRELRATLGVLRRVDDGGDPGLARLPALVERARRAGLPVTYEVLGEPRPPAEGADLAAYRIVQEALTNVLKHAGTPATRVIAEYGGGTVTLRVTDDGEPVDGRPGHGMGLIGMRERAVAAGGSLSAGPLPGGGFRVETELPLAGPA